MRHEIREISIESLDAVSGGRVNLANSPAYHGPRPHAPGTVGEGDTIDGIPFGQKFGDGSGSWGTVNGNLPGSGPWGN